MSKTKGASVRLTCSECGGELLHSQRFRSATELIEEYQFLNNKDCCEFCGYALTTKNITVLVGARTR